jgi:SAM-dependent methyltransferase
VIGVDNNERFLGLARERYADASFERNDMRELAFESEFDAVVNWFTSFGYFDPVTNDRVLASFARALRPGGRLLLELHNPARLARVVELCGGSAAAVIACDGDLMVDRSAITRRKADRTRSAGSSERGACESSSSRWNRFPPTSCRTGCGGAGFAEVRLFGKGGAPYDPEGPRLVALARTG